MEAKAGGKVKAFGEREPFIARAPVRESAWDEAGQGGFVAAHTRGREGEREAGCV